MKTIPLLKADQNHIEELLVDLVENYHNIYSENRFQRLREILHYMHRDMVIKDKLLYPRFEKVTELESRVKASFRRRRRIQLLMHSILAKCMANDETRLKPMVQRLTRWYSTHHQLEDRELLSQIDVRLSKDQRTHLNRKTNQLLKDHPEARKVAL